MALKKIKQLSIFSDGSSYSEPIIALKNQKDYIFYNQDLNNHTLSVIDTQKKNNLEKSRLLRIVAHYRVKYNK